MTDPKRANLLADLPTILPEEMITVLAMNPQVRIERIVSTGQCSKPGFWYDQDEHEWVALLKGQARLLFEDEEEPINMRPGDHVLIPAHRRHRVEWTAPDEPTVWLAVFYSDSDRQK
jgi:cupin 2 domain-containing protein